MDTETKVEQIVGFTHHCALYSESGWAEQKLEVHRQGDTSKALSVVVKFTTALNESAPSSQNPIYERAVEILWRAGEKDVKEVPIRIKPGSVHSQGLCVIAILELPVSQEIVLDKGMGMAFIRIDNSLTCFYDDKSSFYEVKNKSLSDLNSSSISSISESNSIPVATDPSKLAVHAITPFLPPNS